MSGRGHRAALPAGGHARPEYLVADGQGGLVVRHYNREGRVREYDFAQLPVPAPMQASLAAAVRRPVHAGPLVRALPRRRRRGSSCGSSRSSWPASSGRRVTWTSSPRRLVRRWRESLPAGAGGYYAFGRSAACCSAMTPGCRRGRSPTSWPAAARQPRSKVQSYSEAEFDQVTAAARRRFRAALQRISDNAAAPAALAGRGFAEGSGDWVLGEGLDILARTGDLPRYARQGAASGTSGAGTARRSARRGRDLAAAVPDRGRRPWRWASCCWPSSAGTCR